MANGDFAHFEIPADDVVRARGFYERLFGWKFDAPPGMGGYLVFTTPNDIGGGLGERGKSAPDQVRVYFTVDSIEGALALTGAAGGSTVLGRTGVPGFGWYAVIRDTEGTEVGLWEGLPR